MRNEQARASCLASALKFARENPERVAETKRRWQLRHPDQMRTARRRWKEENKELHISVQRRSHLWHKFGITPEQHDALLQKQGNVCAICKGPQNPKYRFFDVDHDHATDTVRGLLCRRCNIQIAPFEKDHEWMARVIEYLRGPGGE